MVLIEPCGGGFGARIASGKIVAGEYFTVSLVSVIFGGFMLRWLSLLVAMAADDDSFL